ncbi:MAG TPA: pitrilysin family protein [Vicinamibacterales bacterium]|nr:pitrilysin family protein [Vicinamibacterales bacterium]
MLAAFVAAQGATEIPKIQFEKYTLANGLEVILKEDHRLPIVAVNLWYHVGPANESAGRTGFAHLFEHLMFQGSKHTPKDSHFQMLEAAGATGINGTTDYDRTNYFETVPSNRLELALWIESDRMGYLLDAIDAKEFANQQDVVRNERRQSVENRPYGNAEEELVHMLYPPNHPYYANVIGSHADIQAARLDDARQFFRRYYAPNNASVAIVGDFDPAQTKKLVEKYFGPLKRGAAVPPIDAQTPKITMERRKVVPDRVELPRVYMAWLTPSIFKPGDAEADMAAEVLGGGRASRLYQKLVYEKQIAQNVDASQQSLLLGSQFQIDATARPGHTAEELEAAINAELEALRTRPVEPRELEQARNTIETQAITRLENLNGVANMLNSYNHFLKTPDYLQKDVERYRAVTPASLMAFVRDQLQPSMRAVVYAVKGDPVMAPQVPTPPAPTTAGAGTESVNIDEPWRNEMPKPGAARTLQVPVPETAQLANGLTLILSTRRGLPIVASNLVVKSGSDTNPPDQPGLANFTVSMLDQGTATRNAPQIANEVAQLGATLNTNSSMDASIVAARSLKKNFAATLDLAADIALHPSFPAEEIERQRASRLAQLVQQRENANILSARIVNVALYGDRHPYGFTEIGTEASVKALTRDAMLRFWKQNFVPNNAALVVAGDITMAELRPLAEKVFGAWQRGTPAKPAVATPATTQARVLIVDRPGAPQTQIRIGAIGAPRSAPEFQAIQVMNTELGGLFSSRINMNLREDHGYTYGASSQFSFRRAAGPFQIASGIRTDVTGPAVGEIFKEVKGMVEKPMTAEELQKAKDSMANSLPGAFESSANAVNNFSNVFIYNLGLDYYSSYAAQVQAVTADQALTVAKKYLVPQNMVVIAVGDRKAIEPELVKLSLGPLEIRDAEGRVAK